MEKVFSDGNRNELGKSREENVYKVYDRFLYVADDNK